MDHTRDNPLKRFTAFWVALLLVTAFGIACLIVGPFTKTDGDSSMKAAADERRAVRAKVDSAQSSALNELALEKAFEANAKTLRMNVPIPGKAAVPAAAPAPAAEPEPASE
ncbi:MAG: hypothetical protein ACJAQT_000708 [Akkermansiaceae bacterium]|jgi:hypothetical protein